MSWRVESLPSTMGQGLTPLHCFYSKKHVALEWSADVTPERDESGSRYYGHGIPSLSLIDHVDDAPDNASIQRCSINGSNHRGRDAIERSQQPLQSSTETFTLPSLCPLDGVHSDRIIRTDAQSGRDHFGTSTNRNHAHDQPVSKPSLCHGLGNDIPPVQ